MHVVEQGAGPAVLFCHGFPAIWSCWRVRRLAIALDMCGYGESDAPERAEAYTPFHRIGDLVAILDPLGIPSAILVGHDFGADIAWNAAIMRPDRFIAVFGISVPFRPPGGPQLPGSPARRWHRRLLHIRADAPRGGCRLGGRGGYDTGRYYWTWGGAPADTRWNPFDPARGLLRPVPAPIRTIDPAYLDAAVASFARTGFHGVLNYYRAIDPFVELASRAYAGAVVARPSFFLTGGCDGLNALTRPDEASLRAGLPACAAGRRSRRRATGPSSRRRTR